MKITDVITHQLVVDVDDPFTSARGSYYKTKGALFGLLGQAACPAPSACRKTPTNSPNEPKKRPAAFVWGAHEAIKWIANGWQGVGCGTNGQRRHNGL